MESLQRIRREVVQMVTLLKGIFLEVTDSSTKTVEDYFALMLRITQELAHMKHLAQDLAQSKSSKIMN